jgi:hypothetical protein
MNGAAHPLPRHVPLQHPPTLQQQQQQQQLPLRMNGQPNSIRVPNPPMPPFPHGRSPPNIESTFLPSIFPYLGLTFSLLS